MELFQVLALMLTTAAIVAWFNHRFVGLPTTIGVMLVALAMSLGLQGMSALGVPVKEPVVALLEQVDFSHALLDVMLSFLLFAGALHVNVGDLLGNRWIIGGLATLGVAFSTLLVAALFWAVAGALGLEISFLHAMLFGALISPTDPIAVLGIMKSAKAPKSLEAKIAGESLFNDGIGVVVFTVLVALAGAGHAGEPLGAAGVLELFAVEVLLSLVLGFGAGYVAYLMLRSVDSYHVEVLITLALCVGVYALAASLHSSGPLAVVTAGLLIGNTGRQYAMSPKVVEHVDTFWELVDEILNVVLFVLVGMEVLIVPFESSFLVLGLIAIPLVLLARFLAVGSAVTALRRVRTFTPHAVKVMTWGGLRGGISIALALLLPADLPARDLILTATYVVVVFSIAVQGLTVGKLVARIPREKEAAPAVPPSAP
jgi:CPA1 family monovalent cation:H+ antiporter